MRPEVLCKFHSLGLFLPELDVAVQTASDQEVSPLRYLHMRNIVSTTSPTSFNNTASNTSEGAIGT